jgi:FkbM family methyltransferase
VLRSLLRQFTRRAAPVAVPSATAAQPGDAAVPAAIWLTGHTTGLFRQFAPAIVDVLPERVAGIVATDDIDAGRSSASFTRRDVPFRPLGELRAAASAGPVHLVHFCECPSDYEALGSLCASAGVAATDFLAVFEAIGMAHTYVSMRDERNHALAASADYARVRASFDDVLSGATLDARIAALTRLDRRALVEVMLGLEFEYFNPVDAGASLVPRPDGVYVDVGAAHGDTVARYAAVTGGRFRAIHAFEPTAGQYRELAAMAAPDPRIRTYPNAVGESSGPIPFFDNTLAPFGSNALTIDRAHPEAQVECVRLDDVIDACDLLKLDVEGFECAVLRGGRDMIARSHPDLAIACYHYPADLAEIFDLVMSIHPYRHVALRHHGAALFDTVLLFSDRQAFTPVAR